MAKIETRGRKTIQPGQLTRRASITLPPETERHLIRFGKGNVSAGIRVAVALALGEKK